MTDNTTLIQAFGKRLLKSQAPGDPKEGQTISGDPAVRMEGGLSDPVHRYSKEEHGGMGGKCEEVHPGLSHSQFSITAPEKHGMSTYEGGVAPIFGQGSKGLVYDEFSKRWVEPKEIQKSLPGIYCDWCHQGPFNRYVPYRGQKVCVKCINEDGPSRRPLAK